MGEVATDDDAQRAHDRATALAADLAKLRALNPRATPARIQIYADALADYREAQANIAQYGAIVNHPRTGAPITNPYIAIRDRSADRLLKLDLKAAGLW